MHSFQYDIIVVQKFHFLVVLVQSLVIQSKLVYSNHFFTAENGKKTDTQKETLKIHAKLIYLHIKKIYLSRKT